MPAPDDRDDDRELELPLLAAFAPPLFFEDEPDELRFEVEPDEPLFIDEPREDLLLADRDELPPEPPELFRLVEREEPPPDEAELRLPFDADDELFEVERELPLPLDLRSLDFPDDERELPRDDELLDDAFDPPLDELSLPLMFDANADCTTLAAPSTAPIAALVRSVPAASAALDNKPLDRLLLVLDL